jgi:hypothetical protein
MIKLFALKLACGLWLTALHVDHGISSPLHCLAQLLELQFKVIAHMSTL